MVEEGFEEEKINKKMDSKILLGKILQRFADIKISQVEGYNKFGYIKETNTSVHVTREDGEDTPIPFSKILKGIEAYQKDNNFYDDGPNVLRDIGITHITSPIWSILHLLEKEEYHS